MSTKVLVVEDNPDNQKLITWVLEDNEYVVTCVDTGERALEITNEEEFEIILMDVGLPGINGEEATKRLRADSRFLTLPIIAVTAHAITSEVERIMSAGFTELATKPIDEEELLLLMEKVISEQRQGG